MTTASIGRRLLWRAAFTVTGGVRVIGTLPSRPCVIVANHSSHADVAALLAAIPARRRPAVAAAADYWFGVAPSNAASSNSNVTPPRGGGRFGGVGKRAVCRWLAGAFPVRRGGGGSADLAGAVPLLREGRDVIVFPEGTRSRDGRIADFHSGAARLATQAGVAMLPVGIHGTRDLMPVHGRPGRARVTVRIGEPTADLAQARSAVADLATPAGRHRARARSGVDSSLRRRVAALAVSGTGAITVAAWAFLKASI